MSRKGVFKGSNSSRAILLYKLSQLKLPSSPQIKDGRGPMRLRKLPKLSECGSE